MKVEHRPKEGGPNGVAFFFGFRAQIVGLSQSIVCEVFSQKNGIGPRQLGLDNMDNGGFLLVVPFRQDFDLLKERLVIAALDGLRAGAIDLGHISSQLQRHPEHRAVKAKLCFGSCQRFPGCFNLAVDPRPLLAESVGRHGVA